MVLTALKHWIWQRILALLALLSLVFISFSFASPELSLKSLSFIISIIFFFGFTIFHGNLGIEIILQDYISDTKIRGAIYNLSTICSIISFALFAYSLFTYHFLLVSNAFVL